MLIGELWLPDRERFALYLRPDELHTAFNFDFLACPWEAEALRRSVVATLDAHAPVDAPPTWVLSNHDVTRVVTRYGREDTTFSFGAKRMGIPTDLPLGLARARAAALLTMALPGSFYLYQGDELGLPEVEDLPVDRLQDPMHFQSGGVDPGRDGCRVPLPWSGTMPPFGFSPGGARAETWLPQPARLGRPHGDRPARPAAARRSSSTARRCASAAIHLADAGLDLQWLAAPADVLAFRRGDVVCVVNLRPAPIDLPWTGTVLVASADPVNGNLPAHAAAWIHGRLTENSPTPTSRKEQQQR